ncbi:alpha-D-ribose 1-methylphosphonate 5-triphosphate diphosphatase [Paracoccaceae bacterium Fryx2]|nr:alpha-D-ribose 1-methylphosphonate 5-triphosphate diphosphatase [Paracoccaceae bacterium Fryx2]
MTPILPPLRLTGAEILRDGELQRRSIAIADGRITRGPLPEVDLTGFLILPGIIDLHGDGMEHHIAPRAGAAVPLNAALAAADREAAAHGLTTAFLAQGWSWEGGLRSPDAAEALLVALDRHRLQALTDLRVMIRAETHLVGSGARLIAAVQRHRVGYVLFADRLEAAAETRHARPALFAALAAGLGQDVSDLSAALDAARARGRDVPRHLCTLAEAFDALGVLYGSKGDPDGETRERYSMIGARIAAFPATRRAAAAAHAMMSPVILGAPAVLGARGPAGSVAACDLIAEGLCDALVSDGQVPALVRAALALVDRGLATLPEAWAMLSANPAEILRLPDRGRLTPGLRADLVVMRADTREVEATICGGRLSYLAGEAGRRFLSQPQPMRMAAE